MKPHRLLVALVCLVAALASVLWFVIDPAPATLPVSEAANSLEHGPSASLPVAETIAPPVTLQAPLEAPVVNDARQDAPEKYCRTFKARPVPRWM